jgi:hypothetical protein
VLTFDLSLDGKFSLSRQKASQLLQKVQSTFDIPNGFDPQAELANMEKRDQILSTDHVKKTDPALLPWKHPLLKSVHDLLHGHGWTGGFRSKSVYCLAALAK